ncbi:protein phosphatase Mn(2+)-dependent 1K [Procambarus clarkii]|uniref:protein phosphatase Mn(2+)-dependent 1K n=1 Tax=Procambarus clarkii TaxID=6728 RepID=UPI001E66FF11|nr:protein phosphatase 1K, mitochondrial-like [Procambarus clarkii]XP_045584428.1 protein phosphatase 1K, mitochondrial-like [Procambarus clarkii]XP_045584430.1 protein phosphatase 1K, mitochondrial-like [Procambarus clarkii]XP_045584431.1 protein phosphatase 1K, mitochondrial-like [Procambarus clarkii]XP_045584432.1 protein phosphatase 1K, mitochondrial-like [Procambarus clarkii]XP_045584433.1 protein phosphatase 1K, mitochondrial-like [Procambarus clarkii]XP_045584434.1 protein phosphatase 
MHRIFFAQKRVLKVNVPISSKTLLDASSLQHSSDQLPVIFSRTPLVKSFVSLSQASSYARGEGCLGIRSSNCNVLNKFTSPNITNVLKLNTSEADSSAENESSQKKDFNFDALGAWDNRIDLPIMMDASIKHGSPIPMIVASDVGRSTILGKRTYQEDRYVTEDLPNNILCSAVFDGHGGSECSEYCAQNLKEVLLEHLAVHKDLEAVLHHTFLKLHSGYTQWTQQYKTGLKAGTTATVCLLRGGVELAVGHVGDSRAILYRSGSPRELTRDHCPSLISEKDRIIKSGGKVSVDNIGRHMVNDSLSMTRSIGDLHLKPYGVIALPDAKTLRVKHGKDAFLLLITDGINFVLRSEEACQVINQAEDPYRAAQLLTEQALSMSSEDNMTALVVPFGSWGKYTKSASMFYSFGIGRDMNKSSRFG